MGRFYYLTVQRHVTGALHLAVLLRLQHLIPFSCPVRAEPTIISLKC